MARFHLNDKTGNPGKCGAQPGNCPFGGDEVHYPSEADARIAFEHSMAGQGTLFTPGSAASGQPFLPGMKVGKALEIPTNVSDPFIEGEQAMLNYLHDHLRQNIRPASVAYTLEAQKPAPMGREVEPVSFTLSVHDDGDSWSGQLVIDESGEDGEYYTFHIEPENSDAYAKYLIDRNFLNHKELGRLASPALRERLQYDEDLAWPKRNVETLVKGSGIVSRRYSEDSVWLNSEKSLNRQARKFRQEEQAWLAQRAGEVEWARPESVTEFTRALNSRREAMVNEVEDLGFSHKLSGEKHTWAQAYYYVSTNMPYQVTKPILDEEAASGAE